MEKAGKQFVNELRREYRQVIDRIMSANGDLDDRLRSARVEATYYGDDDTLAITIDGPCEALSQDIDDDLYLRVDPGTYKLCGVQLLHFSQHLQARSKVLQAIIGLMRTAGVADVRLVIEAGGGETGAMQGFRELITA